MTNHGQRFWQWWTQPAGRRFHVIPSYVLLAVACTLGVGVLRHQDAHNRELSCLIGRSNDIAIRQAFGDVDSAINRIVLTFIGNPSFSDDPRAIAVARSLDDLNQKVDALTVRQCGERGIISPSNP